jgi:hypothetical protein
MAEYHKQDEPTDMLGAQLQVLPPDILDPWQDFVATFEGKLGDGKATFNRSPKRQSLEEEYTNYVTASYASTTSDAALRFWTVSFTMECTCVDRHNSNRQMKQCFLPFFALLWITCPFRRQQLHANAFSLRVQRLMWRKGTVYCRGLWKLSRSSNSH